MLVHRYHYESRRSCQIYKEIATQTIFSSKNKLDKNYTFQSLYYIYLYLFIHINICIGRYPINATFIIG